MLNYCKKYVLVLLLIKNSINILLVDISFENEIIFNIASIIIVKLEQHKNVQ